MTKTDAAPLARLDSLKRTKIIATVGPSTDNYESILKMIHGGVNGFRLNFSHGNYEERSRQIKWIRKASKEYDIPVAIIQDLQGLKLRCGDFDDEIILKKGQEAVFEYKANYSKTGHIPTQLDLSKKVKRTQPMLLADGKIRLTISSVRDGLVHARVENDGVLTARKGIFLPETDWGGDVITTKDKKDIVWGSEQDLDYVALSFVQTGEDVKKLRRLLNTYGSRAKIISKIETKPAVENIDDIIAASDAVMVARGDLAVEVSPEAVPIISRQIIGKCLSSQTISIIATQMLASMTDNPEPTRAETSDVATAVIVGADCVMLSDETAVGKHPYAAIKIMRDIILYTQDNLPLKPVFFGEKDKSPQTAIASAILTLAHQVDAKAIVAETKTGSTALSIAASRPKVPILKVTPDRKVAQQLAIVYGGKSFIRSVSTDTTERLTDWLRSKQVFKKGDIIVTASGRYPGKITATDTIKVRVLE